MTEERARLHLSERFNPATYAPNGQGLLSALCHSFAPYRTSELLLLAYFTYTAFLASFHALPARQQAIAWCIPFTLWLLARMEARFSRKWSSVVRDWAPLGLILPGYWQADWFEYASWNDWQVAWNGWDRVLLHQAGMRAAIEAFGWPIPSLLETVYLLLYAVPALALGAVYWYAGRRNADRYLTTLFAGTLVAYVLLPHFPTVSPRLAFPGQDLPSFTGFSRAVNVFLLDNFDVSKSVFPSGHVAVAFSTAFGLLRAVPARARVWAPAFALAASVFVATVYCRYHYAADGFASIGISILSWRLTEVLSTDA